MKLKTLFSQNEINERLKILAEQINQDYIGKELSLLVVMKGAMVFASDLIRLLDLKLTVDYIRVKSYVGTSAGQQPLQYLSDQPLEFFQGKHVLLLEDIVDKGRTLKYLQETLSAFHPETLKVCSLLYKDSAFVCIDKIDYSGFKIANDTFVVGYGMDYDQAYRQLPYLASLS